MVLPLILMQTIMYQGNAKFKKYIGMASHLCQNVYHHGDKGWRGCVVIWGEENLPTDGKM